MGRVVQKLFKDACWESSGKHHITAALLKGTLDGTQGPHSQGLSWFGGSGLIARWLEKNWAVNEGDRFSRVVTFFPFCICNTGN